MNFEDRVGQQDDTAAALFAAARAYRAPARSRRRALRALGLPVGLSLLAPSVAQAAAAVFASAKGWVVVIGVVAATAGAVEAVHVVAARRGGSGPRVSHGPRVPRVIADAAGSAVAANASPRPVLASAPDLLPVLLPSAIGQGSGAIERARGGAAVTARGPVAAISRTTTPARTATRVARATIPATTTTPAPTAERAATEGGVGPTEMTAGSDVSRLRAELVLVGEARARLRAGDARATLALLADYARRFPAGALAEEVDLLAMRALVAAGDAGGARRRGNEFLSRHPGSPLEGAVRALLDSPTPRGQEGEER